MMKLAQLVYTTQKAQLTLAEQIKYHTNVITFYEQCTSSGFTPVTRTSEQQVVIDDLNYSIVGMYIWEGLDELSAFNQFLIKQGNALVVEHVLWWLEPYHPPQFLEARQRLEHLIQHGDSAIAFRLSHPFDHVNLMDPTL